jgi:dTDP-4-amino-4,6-dideoxygalactose transaminase
MPAWICHEVKTAAEIAGKHIIYVDLAPNSINAGAAEYAAAAKPGRILLAAHLFGVPTDIEAICELARERRCVTIEDAVPALGGRQNGHLLGTFADFGIFGFEWSKRYPAFHGGVIVVNNENILEPATLGATRIGETRRVIPMRELLRALVHNLATPSWIYRNLTVRLLPLRQVGSRLSSDSDDNSGHAKSHSQRNVALQTSSYNREIHYYQAELLIRMLARIDEIRQQVGDLVTTYLEHFRNSPIATFVPAGCDHGGFLRFPIAFPGKSRAEILQVAKNRGIYLKTHWPKPLPNESEHAKFPNATWVSQNLVLLPLYRRLSTRSAEFLARSIVEIEKTLPAQRAFSAPTLALPSLG